MKNESFKLRGDFIELFKLLKITGLCASGGEAKAVIAEGSVTVNDVVETRKACKIKIGSKVQYADTIIEIV